MNTTQVKRQRATQPEQNIAVPHLELAYCPMCTHTVQAMAAWNGRRLTVTPGQKCGHCHAALDAGYAMRREQAA